MDGLQLRQDRPHAPTLLVNEQRVERVWGAILPTPILLGRALSSSAPRVRPQRVEREVQGGSVHPRPPILDGHRRRRRAVEPTERIGGDFLRLSGVAEQAAQGPDEGWVVLCKTAPQMRARSQTPGQSRSVAGSTGHVRVRHTGLDVAEGENLTGCGDDAQPTRGAAGQLMISSPSPARSSASAARAAGRSARRS